MVKNRIKELRQKNSLTLKELGQKVGMANNTLSQYETAQREPKLETWQKLADFFGVSVPYLQGIENHYTKKDVLRFLNNAYFHLDKFSNKDIHGLLKEYFYFFPDIPKPKDLYTIDEIKKYAPNVQKYWQKYFSFITDHKLMQFIYKAPISREANLILESEIYDLLADNIILNTETPLSRTYEDKLQETITFFDDYMMYETRFGNKEDVNRLLNNLMQEIKSLKKEIKKLPDNMDTKRPQNFIGMTFSNAYRNRSN